MKKGKNRTRRLAISALLSALGVVILYLGALVEVLDLSVAVLASLLCVLALLEMGGAWPWLIYAAVSILSLVLLPLKTAAVAFALYLGYYPIVKAYFERLPRAVSLALKLLHFLASLTVLLLLSRFLLPEPVSITLPWYAAIYLGGLLFFLLYDLALTRAISFYLYRLRVRLRIKGW